MHCAYRICVLHNQNSQHMTLLVENANNSYTQAIYSHDGDPQLGQGEAGRSLLHPVLAAERQELRHHRHLLTVIITNIIIIIIIITSPHSS